MNNYGSPSSNCYILWPATPEDFTVGELVKLRGFGRPKYLQPAAPTSTPQRVQDPECPDWRPDDERPITI